MRRSLGVSPSPAGARPPIRESSARAFPAQSVVPSSSNVSRADSSEPRAFRFCLAPSLRGAQRELRPRELEGLSDAIVELDRAFEMLQRLHRVLESGDEPSTTGRGGHGERPVELDAPVFEGLQRLLGASELPKADECLDVVGHERVHAGLDDAPGPEQVGKRLQVSA